MYDIQTENASERGLIVGLVLPDVSLREAQDTLDELTLLADTAGVEVVEQVLQERQQIEPAYFIGRGKAEEIAEWVKEHIICFFINLFNFIPAIPKNHY